MVTRISMYVGVSHSSFSTGPVAAVLARTGPNEQESVVLLSEWGVLAE
jgi:uncharacterized RmlC-like cupin family protein